MSLGQPRFQVLDLKNFGCHQQKYFNTTLTWFCTTCLKCCIFVKEWRNTLATVIAVSRIPHGFTVVTLAHGFNGGFPVWIHDTFTVRAMIKGFYPGLCIFFVWIAPRAIERSVLRIAFVLISHWRTSNTITFVISK